MNEENNVLPNENEPKDQVMPKQSMFAKLDPSVRQTAVIVGLFVFVSGLFLLFFSVIIAGGFWYSTKVISEKIEGLYNFGSTGQQAAQTGPVDIKLAPGTPMLGNADAKITVIEFADFQCPFCKQFFDITLSQLKREYIDTGKVKFAYHDFAFLGEESYLAAEAAKCAQDQGKFWEYHDTLYKNQKGENEGAFSSDNLKRLGLGLGLNTENFNSCVDGRNHKDIVQSDMQAGTSYGVQATPTVFINGIKYEGPTYATLKQALEQALKE